MVQDYQPLYTVKEVAHVLKTNINKVYDIMNSGELPYLIIGTKKIRGIDLEKYINSYPEEIPGGMSEGIGVEEEKQNEICSGSKDL